MSCMPSKGEVCARRHSVIEDSVLPPTDEFAQKDKITPANTALEIVGARPGTNNMSRMASIAYFWHFQIQQFLWLKDIG